LKAVRKIVIDSDFRILWPRPEPDAFGIIVGALAMNHPSQYDGCIVGNLVIA
jgi:hypothetical protein